MVTVRTAEQPVQSATDTTLKGIIAAQEEIFVRRQPNSAHLAEAAQQHLAGGVTSSWQITAPQPVWLSHGHGSKVYDVDGNEYVDLHGGYGAALAGHAHPAIQQGRVAILDDYRESISLGLMKNGIYDLNTTDYRQINLARHALEELSSLVNVRIDNNDYTEVPDADTWIHHAWSGDMAAAESYMPKGVNVDVVGYWFPTDGRGPVANDTNVVLRSATNPVLAHEYLNYFLDLPNVIENISFNGYMQPMTGVTPQALVKEQILPASLLSTVVLPSYFPPRRGRTPASRRRRRALAAGLARGQQRHLRKPMRRQKKNAFFIALAAPGIIWLALLFIVPFYAVLAIAMGKLNELFESPVAVWNPFAWSSENLIDVWHDIFGSAAFAGPIVVRTIVYVAIASVLCLLIGYPAAYFVARFAGRRKGLFLVLLVAPFWISYMMRMLAWVDLLQTGGYVNKALGWFGISPVNWLGGKPGGRRRPGRQPLAGHAPGHPAAAGPGHLRQRGAGSSPA